MIGSDRDSSDEADAIAVARPIAVARHPEGIVTISPCHRHELVSNREGANGAAQRHRR